MTEKVKYPRTWHLPFCENIGDDGDHVLSEKEVEQYFLGEYLVMTEKMDGENTTMYRDGIHARSTTSPSTPWRTYIQGLHASICHLIPEGWRICGENMFAKHSIYYNDLQNYFYVFGVYNQDNVCLSLFETAAWAEKLNLPMVPYICDIYIEKDQECERFKSECLNAFENYKNKLERESEGFVVRRACSFDYKNFKFNAAKYVRKGHVQTDEHWTRQQMIVNQLRK